MPTTLFDSKVIEDAVTAACRAPSLHNSQPWQWVYSDGQLRLFLDPSRVMDTDESAREALIGCGAALDHLQVAMATAGWRAHVELFPNSDSPNYLALMSFDPIDYVTERDRLRAQAIWARRTDRLPFSPPTDWKSIASIWARDVDGKAVRIDTIPDDVLPKLTEAAQIAESLGSTTVLTTMNCTGGPDLSKNRRASHTALWSPRRRAIGSASSGCFLSSIGRSAALRFRKIKPWSCCCPLTVTAALMLWRAAKRFPRSCWNAPWLASPRAR